MWERFTTNTTDSRQELGDSIFVLIKGLHIDKKLYNFDSFYLNVSRYFLGDLSVLYQLKRPLNYLQWSSLNKGITKRLLVTLADDV